MLFQTSKEKWALLSLSACMLLSSMGTSIANIALPQISQSFSAGYSEIQWVIIAYLVSNTAFIILAGRLGDSYGRRNVLGLGIVIFSLSSFLCALSPSLSLIIAGRALQGIGSAALMSLTIALASDLFGRERLGRIMGALGTSSAVGTASGPSVGGLILNFTGWQFIFFFLAIMGSAVFVMSYLFIPVQTISRAKAERKKVSLHGLKALFPGLLMNVCVSTVMMSTLVAGPFYLKQTLHLNALFVGLVMTVGPLASIISGIPAGRSVDKFGAPNMIVSGLSLMIMGCLAFTFLPPRLGVLGYALSAALLSPGYQMFQAANNSMVMTKVSVQHKGLLSGLLSFARNSGLIIGASLMGMIFSRYGMGITFFIASIIASAALLIAIKSNNFGRRTI